MPNIYNEEGGIDAEIINIFYLDLPDMTLMRGYSETIKCGMHMVEARLVQDVSEASVQRCISVHKWQVVCRLAGNAPQGE